MNGKIIATFVVALAVIGLLVAPLALAQKTSGDTMPMAVNKPNKTTTNKSSTPMPTSMMAGKATGMPTSGMGEPLGIMRNTTGTPRATTMGAMGTPKTTATPKGMAMMAMKNITVTPTTKPR